MLNSGKMRWRGREFLNFKSVDGSVMDVCMCAVTNECATRVRGAFANRVYVCS